MQTGSENSPQMAFSKNKHSNYIKRLIYKRKTAVFIPAVCIGKQGEPDVEQKLHLNYALFLAHREEILARKDITHQLWLMMKAG